MGSAPLQQKNLRETLCSKNYGRVGRSTSVLAKANNVTKHKERLSGAIYVPAFLAFANHTYGKVFN